MSDAHDLMQKAKTLPNLRSMPKKEFILWLANNYPIYQAFHRFAMEALNSGRTRFSAYMIRERVRWETTIEWRGEFKITNNATPYLARLLILDIPALKGVLHTHGDP